MLSDQDIVTITFTAILGIVCLFVGFHCMKLFCQPLHKESESEDISIEDPQMIQVIVKQSPLRVTREEDPVAPV